jgi:hypothetical protein
VTLPQLVSRIAFGYPPSPAGAPWTDCSDALRGLATSRGRNYERDQVNAGSATPLFNNGDRRFDPTYTHSPYYPNVKPMVRAQHSAVWAGTEYFLHTGFVERWPIDWQGRWGTSAPTVTDAFASLAIALAAGDFPEETTGARIQRMLTASGWPSYIVPNSSGWRLGTDPLDTGAMLAMGVDYQVIDPGSVLVSALTVPEDQPVPALAHIQECAQAEDGVFFIDAYGRAVFQDRMHRIGVQPELVLTDDPVSESATRVAYQTIELDEDIAHVYNEVIVSSDIGGVTETVSAVDTDSISSYLRRPLALNLPLTSTDAMQARANWELLFSSQPYLRVDSITFKPQRNPACWPAVLQLELGDKLRVEWTPLSALTIPAEQITMDAFVEQIEHAITPSEWTITLALSPAAAQERVWVLDASRLETQTMLI